MPFDKLDEWAERLERSAAAAAKRAKNETELRLLIEPEIRTAVYDLYALDLDQIRSERQTEGGTFDTAYGGVVVEYKFQMGAARGVQQLNKPSVT